MYALALAALSPSPGMVLPTLKVPATAQRGRKGAGISMAMQKRASVKKRNVARNRGAHRA